MRGLRELGAMLYSWEDRAGGEALILQELGSVTSYYRQRVLVDGSPVRENHSQTPCFQALVR